MGLRTVIFVVSTSLICSGCNTDFLSAQRHPSKPDVHIRANAESSPVGVRYLAHEQRETVADYNFKPIVLVACIVSLLAVILIGVTKTISGKAIFFKNHFDIFLGFLPFLLLGLLVIAVRFGLKIDQQILVRFSHIAIASSVLYSYARAYSLNRHNKALALCIGTSRITLGYILPILAVLLFIGAIILLLDNRTAQTNHKYSFSHIKQFVFLATVIMLLESLVLSTRVRWTHKGTSQSNRQKTNSYSYSGNKSYENGSSYKSYSGSNNQKNESDYKKKSQAKQPDTYTTACKILNVPMHATLQEIKNAYRKLALKYHPDKVSNLGAEVREFAHKKMKDINWAYEILVKAAKAYA